jgi:hypothetical protein
MTNVRSGVVVVVLGACLAGCYSKATGHDGKLTFAYASGVEVENFVKPIAPGAKLDVVAFANGTDDELTVTSAKSSRPDVLAVDAVRRGRVVVRGVSEGVADLEITARDGAGGTLVDRMFFHVRTPAVHRIEHACTEDPDAVYVAGEPIDVFHGLATNDKRPVVGYGYAPVAIEPRGALDLVAQPQGSPVYRFRAAKASKVRIRSSVDGSALSLDVVDRRDLKDGSLSCFGDCKLIEGRSTYVFARVRHGEHPLCNQSALTKAKSLTPETCSVTARLDDDPDARDENKDQLALVKGLKFGVCKYEIVLPELDGGRGLRLAGEVKVGREQYPGEGSGGGESLLSRAASPSPRSSSSSSDGGSRSGGAAGDLCAAGLDPRRRGWFERGHAAGNVRQAVVNLERLLAAARAQPDAPIGHRSGA